MELSSSEKQSAVPISTWQRPKLTLLERLGIIWIAIKVVSGTYLDALKAPFRGSTGAPSLFRHIVLAAFRRIQSHLPVRAYHGISPSTDEMYAIHAKKRGFPEQTEVLPDGTKAHWIGDKRTQKIVLYFHGGGYALAALSEHITYLDRLQRKCQDAGHQFSILLLSYVVTPYAHYPRQLQQAMELVRYTINILEKDPADIFLAGDSAGGNLALGVLSSISHPHPSIQPLDLSSNLAGAILISPWVKLGPSPEPFWRNGQKDILSPVALENWAAIFLDGAPPDPYNEPIVARPGWWTDLKVQDLLILAGGDELLVDDITELATRIQTQHPKTTFVIGKNEIHFAPIGDLAMGYNSPGEQAQAIESWIMART